MNMNDVVTLVSGIIVAMLVVISMLIPIISVATDNEETFVNSGSVLLREVESGEEITGSIDYTAKEIIVNGESQSLDYPINRSSVLVAPNCMIGYNWGANNVMEVALDYWDGNGASHITGTNVAKIEFVIPSDHTVIITVTNVQNSVTTVNIPANDWMLIKDDNGKYTQVTNNAGQSVYTNSLENIYAGSWSFINSYQFGVKGSDVSVNGIEGTVFWDSEEVLEDVYEIDISYVNRTSYVEFEDPLGEEQSFNIFIVYVPVEVIGYSEQNMMLNTMLYVIPILIVVGIVFSIIRNSRT